MKRSRRKRNRLFAGAVLLSLWAKTANGAWAYCDTMGGSVAEGAQLALGTDTVAPALQRVQSGEETERPAADRSTKAESLDEHGYGVAGPLGDSAVSFAVELNPHFPLRR